MFRANWLSTIGVVSAFEGRIFGSDEDVLDGRMEVNDALLKPSTQSPDSVSCIGVRVDSDLRYPIINTAILYRLVHHPTHHQH
jgi:hypothetical protein